MPVRRPGLTVSARVVPLCGILVAALALLGGCKASNNMTDRTDGARDVTPNASAPLLHVALQEGFEDVVVEVWVNGTQAYRKDGVLTDLRIGLADSFEMPMPNRPVVVQVSLPSIGVSDSVRVDVDGSAYVGVSYVTGMLRFKVSDQPFGYL